MELIRNLATKIWR